MEKWTPIIKAANIKPEGNELSHAGEDASGHRWTRGDLPPLIVRRIDAIPVALPLKAPMKMAGITITKAENLLVRVEAHGRPGRLGRGALGADDDRRHARRARRRRARSSCAAAHRQGCAGRRTLGRCCSARSSAIPARIRRSRWRCSISPAARAKRRLIDLVARPPRTHGRADVAARQCDSRTRTSPKRRRSRREGFDFFKLKIGVKPLARRDRGRARDPRGAPRCDALRRRQLRPDARGCAPLRGAHARGRARSSSSSRLAPTTSPA